MKPLNNYINQYNPYSNVYGFARTLLAMSTLVTLLFNDTSTLFSYARDSISCDHVTIPSAFCVGNELGLPIELIRYIMIFCLIIVASGWRPRFTGIVHWYIAYSLQASALTIDGGEQINTVLAFLLIPITLLDHRKNHFIALKENPNNFYSKYISLLFVITLKFQVFLIYGNAAIERLKNPEWSDGTALYYFFSDSVFGLPGYQLAFLEPILNSHLVIPLTWSVTIFEFFLAACIIATPKIKKVGYALGILFHIAIMLTIGIVTFGLTMVAAVIFYLRPFNEGIPIKKHIKAITDYFKQKRGKSIAENGESQSA